MSKTKSPPSASGLPSTLGQQQRKPLEKGHLRYQEDIDGPWVMQTPIVDEPTSLLPATATMVSYEHAFGDGILIAAPFPTSQVASPAASIPTLGGLAVGSELDRFIREEATTVDGAADADVLRAPLSLIASGNSILPIPQALKTLPLIPYQDASLVAMSLSCGRVTVLLPWSSLSMPNVLRRSGAPHPLPPCGTLFLVRQPIIRGLGLWLLILSQDEKLGGNDDCTVSAHRNGDGTNIKVHAGGITTMAHNIDSRGTPTRKLVDPSPPPLLFLCFFFLRSSPPSLLFLLVALLPPLLLCHYVGGRKGPSPPQRRLLPPLLQLAVAWGHRRRILPLR
ncbi:hypothetical protein Taro_013507 [Colocasia esculenta]|uniref:Uncharacterized protein n=1 Tax=Colocasia esculenta TaxID=4460 RepID=A0A843UGF5_COLES|nr:hypothetical protein [Colocasia esculenta]